MGIHDKFVYLNILISFLLEQLYYLYCGLQDIAEHLTTVHLKRCPRGKRCLYEGSTPPGGFPNSWVISVHTILNIAISILFYHYYIKVGFETPAFFLAEWSKLLYFRTCNYEEQ